MTLELANHYKIKILNESQFTELQKPLRDQVFEDDHSLFPSEFLSLKEKNNIQKLRDSFYNEPFKLFLGVFDKNETFVGWSFGFQVDGHTFYMCNSAILKEHRRQGLYTSLLRSCLKILKEEGFQVIYSRHNATNNAVIIPKLKEGFVISSLELDDIFGTLVHLKYFSNKTRQKVMDYRSGQSAPDAQLKKLFKM